MGAEPSLDAAQKFGTHFQLVYEHVNMSMLLKENLKHFFLVKVISDYVNNHSIYFYLLLS